MRSQSSFVAMKVEQSHHRWTGHETVSYIHERRTIIQISAYYTGCYILKVEKRPR